MAVYYGDFAEDATVYIPITTSDSNGGAVAPSSAFEAADVVIYKNGSATEKTSTNGLTMTSPFDAVTGLHMLEIDTSNDTGDAGFWVAGADYHVILTPDETVDGQSVVHTVGTFSIENRYMRGTDSAYTGTPPTAVAIRTEIDSNSTQLAAIVNKLPSKSYLTGTANADGDVEMDAATGNFPGSVASVAGAVGSVTGNVGGNVTGSVGSVTGNVGGNVVGNVNGSVASVTGNVGGNVTGSVGSVVADVSVDELKTAALADMFNTDSGTDYASSVAGSVVKEIVDNAGGAAFTVNDIADGVWDEARADHTSAGSFGEGIASVQGNITGSVASVVGAVGSVTGNVGGNVVGNVNGSVASVTADVSVDELKASALADMFNTDSGETYLTAVDGSPVKETADNAGGASLTVNDIVDGVWNATLSSYSTAGSTGKAVDDILGDTNELQTDWVDGGRLDALIDTLTSRLTAARAGYLDNLNVTGTLAHSDAASTYKADVSALALEATLTAIKGGGWSTETLVSIKSAIDAIGGDASAANQTTMLTRLEAIMSSTASDPSVGNFDPSTDSLEAIRNRGDAAWTSSGVTGANTVTLTFKETDANGNAIPDAVVTLKNAGGTSLDTATTDSNGQVTFALDDGTYYVYTHKLGSYTFTEPETLTVVGNTTDEYYGTVFSPSAPSSPSLCTVYGWLVDGSGTAVQSIVVSATAIDEQYAGSGQGVLAVPKTASTNASGYFELELVQSKQYLLKITRFGYSKVVTIPASSTAELSTL